MRKTKMKAQKCETQRPEHICPKCGGLCKRDERTDFQIGRVMCLRFWTCMKCGDVRCYEILAGGKLREWLTGEAREFAKTEVT